jgi:hypothetical protein
MGSTTPNFGLFKPDASDYVDVVSDVDTNMGIIDYTAAQLCDYQPVSNAQFASSSPTNPLILNAHGLSNWQSDIRGYSGNLSSATGINGWEATNCTPSGWASLVPFLQSGWMAAGGQPYTPRYRIVKEDCDTSITPTFHVELSGRVAKTGYAALGTVTTGDAQFLTAPFSNSLGNDNPQAWQTAMGNSPASATVFNAARIMYYPAIPMLSVHAYFSITRFVGTAASTTQTAGNTENWFSLDGIRYRVVKG